MVGNHVPQTRAAASRLRLIGFFALLLPCACSLITSLDGLAGGASDALDGASPSEASSEAGDASSAEAEAPFDAAAPFCSALTNSPAFCADFDGTDPVAGWSRTLFSGNGAVVEPSTAAFHSAPRALRSSVGLGGERFAFVERNLATADHVRLSYSIYVDLRPSSDDYEVNILSFTGPGTSYDFYLAIDHTGAAYAQQISTADGGGGVTLVPLTQEIPTKTWRRVVLDVTLTGAREMVVTIDGVEAARSPIAYAQPGAVVARAGITYASTITGPGVLFIDDFLVELP
jgi:hypothetical protein